MFVFRKSFDSILMSNKKPKRDVKLGDRGGASLRKKEGKEERRKGGR